VVISKAQELKNLVSTVSYVLFVKNSTYGV
jgi:hypothetical protein